MIQNIKWGADYDMMAINQQFFFQTCEVVFETQLTEKYNPSGGGNNSINAYVYIFYIGFIYTVCSDHGTESIQMISVMWNGLRPCCQ